MTRKDLGFACRRSVPLDAPSGNFTLLELLVVIALIALLVSMLLPALRLAKESAKTMACANNLKNFAVAGSLYMGDYNGHYPFNPGYFLKYFRVYIDAKYDATNWPWFETGPGDVYVCPSHAQPMLVGGKCRYSYGVNDIGITTMPANVTPADYYARPEKIKAPSKFCLMADATSYRLYAHPTGYLNKVDYRHSGAQANILYLDNHIAPIRYPDVANMGGYTQTANGADFACPVGFGANK